MARPKKLSDADMIRLVDSLYEQCGDHKQLKFSELEKHASTLGVDIKAYNLRRSRVVLRRIAEIKALEPDFNSVVALAYKDLDIDGFLYANKTPAKLKRSLVELDERWRKLYEYTVCLSKRASTLEDELGESQAFADNLKAQIEELSAQMATENKLATERKVENAYLRKAIRKYLYPVLADRILNPEHTNRDFGVPKAAVIALTDGDVPASFSESVSADRKLHLREEHLIERLRLQVLEGGDDSS